MNVSLRLLLNYLQLFSILSLTSTPCVAYSVFKGRVVQNVRGPVRKIMPLFKTTVYANGTHSNPRPFTNHNISRQIYKGYPVDVFAFPFFASLLCRSVADNVTKAFQLWLCGGSIITNTFILTAAHCIAEAEYCSVTVGSVDRNSFEMSEASHGSKKFIVHEDFDRELVTHDIGIVELRTNITFNRFVRPILLPRKILRILTFEGYTGYACGYGVNENGTISRFLKSTPLFVMNRNTCAYEYQSPIHPSVLCAKGTKFKSSICLGDSGGPLIYNDRQNNSVLIGVASFVGTPTCTDEGPSNGFASVPNLLLWLERKGLPVRN